MKKIGVFSLLLGSLALGGCAFTEQSVKLTPDVKVTKPVAANGKTVNVQVVDERSSKNLGQRGARSIGADLTIAGDPSAIIKSSIENGLKQQGFQTAPSGDNRLNVEFRSLDYKVITGFWSGTIRAECGLKAICKSPNANYDKFYRGSFEKDVQVIATEKENDQYVSSAVTDALNQMLNDQELAQCLAK